MVCIVVPFINSSYSFPSSVLWQGSSMWIIGGTSIWVMSGDSPDCGRWLLGSCTLKISWSSVISSIVSYNLRGKNVGASYPVNWFVVAEIAQTSWAMWIVFLKDSYVTVVMWCGWWVEVSFSMNMLLLFSSFHIHLLVNRIGSSSTLSLRSFKLIRTITLTLS